MAAGRLVIATSNKGKVAEFGEIFKALGVAREVVSAREIGGMPDCVEDGREFRDNARIKVDALAASGSLSVHDWVLADDSGLEVEALGGEPGIRSARYAGVGADDASNRQLLVTRMAGIPDGKRGARFVCVLCLYTGEGRYQFFEGECRGAILSEERGTGGFGYDPVFVPCGHLKSWGEMEDELKNRMSHRFRACVQLALKAGL